MCACVCDEERTAGALWAMAGKNIEERLIMAERMSVMLMVDFVNSVSPLLNLIGADGLYALACGPLGQHDNITFAAGMPALIYLVHRTPTNGVTSVAGRPVRLFLSLSLSLSLWLFLTELANYWFQSNLVTNYKLVVRM